MAERLLEAHGLAVAGTQGWSVPLDLVLHEGELLGLYGPAGSGKGLALRVLAGLRPPPRGSVRSREGRRAFVFAHGGLIGNITVLENLLLPLRFSGQDLARGPAALERFGLSHVGESRPATLSTEARQLVQFARAEAVDPHLLFLEDPLRPLARGAAQVVEAWLRGKLAEGRCGAVVSASDSALLARLGARVVALAGGEPRSVYGAEGGS